MTKFTPLPSANAPKQASPQTSALGGVSMLIVDDSAACRMVQAAMARALGATADTAETAVQAMAKSAETAFDLILLDIGLADADGRVLTRTLRDTPNGVRAAILCVSGLGGEDRRAGALNAGADAFAEKPFASIAGFADCARQVLSRRRGEAEPASLDLGEDVTEELSAHVRTCALTDLARARGRMLKSIADGDMPAARRTAHFISGVAGLIGDRSLDVASRSLQASAGDSGALRSIEVVLDLALSAEATLEAGIQ